MNREEQFILAIFGFLFLIFLTVGEHESELSPLSLVILFAGLGIVCLNLIGQWLKRWREAKRNRPE